MKKRYMYLIFVLAFVSCSPMAENPQSSSTMPPMNATQVPSAEVEDSWMTYTNSEIGFSIQYPSTWQEENLPDENDGQMHRIALKGPEGGVELAWGTGFGGACPQGYEPIPVAIGTWPACHSQREDGTEQWSLDAQPIGETLFAGLAYTNDTTTESRDLVLQVLSTLSFP